MLAGRPSIAGNEEGEKSAALMIEIFKRKDRPAGGQVLCYALVLLLVQGIPQVREFKFVLSS